MAWQWQNFMAPLIYIKGKFLVGAVENFYFLLKAVENFDNYSWWQRNYYIGMHLFPLKRSLWFYPKKKKKKSEEEEACGWNARGKSAFLRFFLACFSFNLK